jgi:hypothetical protein
MAEVSDAIIDEIYKATGTNYWRDEYGRMYGYGADPSYVFEMQMLRHEPPSVVGYAAAINAGYTTEDMALFGYEKGEDGYFRLDPSAGQTPPGAGTGGGGQGGAYVYDTAGGYPRGGGGWGAGGKRYTAPGSDYDYPTYTRYLQGEREPARYSTLDYQYPQASYPTQYARDGGRGQRYKSQGNYPPGRFGLVTWRI